MKCAEHKIHLRLPLCYSTQITIENKSNTRRQWIWHSGASDWLQFNTAQLRCHFCGDMFTIKNLRKQNKLKSYLLYALTVSVLYTLYIKYSLYIVFYTLYYDAAPCVSTLFSGGGIFWLSAVALTVKHSDRQQKVIKVGERIDKLI